MNWCIISVWLKNDPNYSKAHARYWKNGTKPVDYTTTTATIAAEVPKSLQRASREAS